MEEEYVRWKVIYAMEEYCVMEAEYITWKLDVCCSEVILS